MRLKVRFIRGSNTFLRTGRLWYQKVLVGLFMRSRLPCASSSFTGSICLWADFPRVSLCRKIKSRATPRETEAIGQRGSSSFSSSRCSPIWSWPSWYLVEKGEQKETLVVQINLWNWNTWGLLDLPVDQNKVKCVSCCVCDSIPNVLQSRGPRRG